MKYQGLGMQWFLKDGSRALGLGRSDETAGHIAVVLIQERSLHHPQRLRYMLTHLAHLPLTVGTFSIRTNTPFLPAHLAILVHPRPLKII